MPLLAGVPRRQLAAYLAAEAGMALAVTWQSEPAEERWPGVPCPR